MQFEIGGLAAGGEGVGRYQGMAVFVPGTVPGDLVRARVVRRYSTHARAELCELLRPSPSRVEPRCPLAGRCGGCQLQHVAYETQLALKTRLVEDALARIGGLEVAVRPCRPSPREWGYRNKAQFPVAMVGYGRDRRLAAGIYARGTHELVEVDECLIQHPTGNRVLRETVALARERRLQAYDEDSGEGLLRHILVRVGERTGEAMVVLVTSRAELPGARSLARELVSRVPEVACVAQNVNPRRTNVILGERTRVIAGKPFITDYLGPFRFRLSPGSFFQVNPAQAEELCRLVAELAATPGEVVELYSGIGTITLFLAERAAAVTGVESHPEAVADARRNAAANRVGNVRFLAGEAERLLPRLVAEGMRAEVLVADPPRRGCARSVLEGIPGLGPLRVVYVSCNPATLARDLAVLAASGYRPVEVVPVDMFPMTAHVEAVALLVSSV